MRTPTAAVLALQGAFIEHERSLKRLGADVFEIRQRADLQRHFDALVIPGGESTVIGKLLRDLGLYSPLRKTIEDGLPVFGTCAGLIVLAKEVVGGEPVFGTLDVKVRRNAYGRQLGSFYAEEDFDGIGKIPMTFIRAPVIESAGPGAEVLAKVDGQIVAARQGRQLGITFHPELSKDLRVHRYFLEEVAGLSLRRQRFKAIRCGDSYPRFGINLQSRNRSVQHALSADYKIRFSIMSAMTGEQPADSAREIPPPSDPGDLYVLGGVYYQGIGVPVDKEKAAALYRMSADKGNADAMVRLGIILMTGDGAEQDYREASKLFRRAADRGNADAEYLLSSLYSRGKGVDRNPIEAVKLCLHAAAEGCTGAMCQMGKWYRDGENCVDRDMAKAVYWLKQAAEKKDAEALYELGCMFAFGEGVEKDEANGRTLLRYADMYGDPDAAGALEALDGGMDRRPE